MASTLYGYTRSINGIVPNFAKAPTVKMIYDAYISGYSFGGLIDLLSKRGIVSPSGKERWSTAALHKMLSDSQYIPLVEFEQYVAAQFELARCSKIGGYWETKDHPISFQ